MQFQARKLGATILATSLFSFACSVSDNDSNPVAHACPRGFNSHWTSVAGLEIIHYDPNNCPIAKEPGDFNMAGGVVEEANAPLFPNIGKTSSLHVIIYDNYNTNYFSGWTILNNGSDWFEREFGSHGRWLAQVFVNYTVRANPDWLDFRVTCNPPVCSLPKAWLRIEYAGQPE